MSIEEDLERARNRPEDLLARKVRAHEHAEQQVVHPLLTGD